MRELADEWSVMGNQRSLLYLMVFALSGMHPGARLAEAGSNSDQIPEVTVIAPRPPTPQELAGKAVPDFLRTHAAPAMITGQLARWNVGICPLTSGLTLAFNDFVSARLLAIAASVGAPTEFRGGCRHDGKHDVFIIFSSDPSKTLEDVVRQDPRVLGAHYPTQTQALERVGHPIQGWYATATRGAHGDITVDEVEPLLPTDGTGNQLQAGKHPAGLPGSRLGSSVHSDIYNALIVVDTKKIVGRSIGSIADYLAVLTLTMASAPERCGTLPSILDMMLPECGDSKELSGVTAGDLAFLRALYKADLEVTLPLERSGMESSMKGQFAGH